MDNTNLYDFIQLKKILNDKLDKFQEKFNSIFNISSVDEPTKSYLLTNIVRLKGVEICGLAANKLNCLQYENKFIEDNMKMIYSEKISEKKSDEYINKLYPNGFNKVYYRINLADRDANVNLCKFFSNTSVFSENEYNKYFTGELIACFK